MHFQHNMRARSQSVVVLHPELPLDLRLQCRMADWSMRVQASEVFETRCCDYGTIADTCLEFWQLGNRSLLLATGAPTKKRSNAM
jgi:hypothetical protein